MTRRVVAYLFLASNLFGAYGNRTAVLLDVGATSLTLHNSGSGGSDLTVACAPGGSQRCRFAFSPGIDVPPSVASISYSSCAAPCTVNINRNWGKQYAWEEITDNAGNPLSPAKTGFLAFPQVLITPTSAGSWTYPIEVIGQEGYQAQRNVTVSGSPPSGLRLYIRGYNFAYPNKTPSDGKCSVQVNSSAWQNITAASVTEIDEERFYGSVANGALETREFTLPIADGVVVTGTNTIGFRFNGTDGVTSGCYILSVNFIEPSIILSSQSVSGNVATNTCSPNCGTYTTGDLVKIYGAPGMRGRFNGSRQITVLNPAQFTFAPCGTNPNLVSCTAPNNTYLVPTSVDTSWANMAQPVRYAARQLLAEPLFVDLTTYTAGAGNASAGNTKWHTSVLVFPATPYLSYAGAATCSTCHDADGRDLKYFNYSNWVIKQRSIFHGLSEADADDIVAYIRGLSTSAPGGRPWNPPYQPGPGLDSNSVTYWSAGAGIDAVQTYGKDIDEYAIPGGSYSSWAWNAKMNLRELPIQYQFPSWNHWLPTIYPGDYFPTFNASTAKQYYADSVAAITDLASYLARDNAMTTFKDSVRNFRDAVNTSRGFDGAPGYLRPSIFTNAIQSITSWAVVKQWEIVHGGGFEGNLSNIYTAQYGSSASGYDSRGLYSAGLHFIMAPHIMGLSVNGFMDNSQSAWDYVSNTTYLMQLALDCGNRRYSGNTPWDSGYTVNFLGLAGGNGGVLQSGYRPNDLLFNLPTIWNAQCGADQPSGASIEMQIASPKNWLRSATVNTQGFSTTAQRVAYYEQIIVNLTATLNSRSPSNWVGTGGMTNCGNPIGGYLGNDEDVCTSIAYALPVLKHLGANSTILANLITAASAIWTGHNFNVDLASGNSGTVNTSGTAVTWASGDQFTNWGGSTPALTTTININGVSKAISSVTDATHLVLTASVGTQTGVSYDRCSEDAGTGGHNGLPLTVRCANWY